MHLNDGSNELVPQIGSSDKNERPSKAEKFAVNWSDKLVCEDGMLAIAEMSHAASSELENAPSWTEQSAWIPKK